MIYIPGVTAEQLQRVAEVAIAERDAAERRLAELLIAARACSEVECDERDLQRLRAAIRALDEWESTRREESQP